MRRKTDYTKLILGTVGLTGIVMLTVIAPNVLGLLKFLPHQKRFKKNYINQTIDRLVKQGLVKITLNDKGIKVVKLTENGKTKLKSYQLKDLQIKKPEKWDGKYRVIIFDIKEWRRSTRDKLRRWFEQLGLIRLQNSVWVYPYDCREIIDLLKANYKIGKEVLYLEVSYLENDKSLRKIFSLD